MEIKLAQTIAYSLMEEHGLLDSHWSFDFDNAVSRLGYCNYRMKRISLSKHATIVNSEDAVRNTILHEIAHALVGFEYGHGPIWKAKARSIGCTGERTGYIAVKPTPKYEIICTLCSHVFSYLRRPRWLHRLDGVYCKSCGKASKGKLSLRVAPGVGIAFTNKIALDKVTII